MKSFVATQRWGFLFKLIVSSFLLTMLAKKMELSQLSPLLHLIPIALLLGAGAYIAAIALMASRWRSLIFSSSSKDIPFNDLFKYYMVGVLYNTLLPGAIGGDFVRGRYLTQRHSMSIKTVGKIIFTERIMGLLTVLIATFVSSSFLSIPKDWVWVSVESQKKLIAVGLLLSLVGLVLAYRWLAGKKFSWLSCISLVLVLLVTQLGDVLALWFLFFIQGISIPFVLLVFSVNVSFLAAAIPISLGGIGVREGVFLFVLSHFQYKSEVVIAASGLLLCSRFIVYLFSTYIYLGKLEKSPQAKKD